MSYLDTMQDQQAKTAVGLRNEPMSLFLDTSFRM